MAMMRRRLFLCFARWILALASNSLGFPFISGCSDLLRTPISSVIGGATGLTCLTGLPASPSLPAAVCLGPSCLVPEAGAAVLLTCWPLDAVLPPHDALFTESPVLP
jgi:hypothetical protein